MEKSKLNKNQRKPKKKKLPDDLKNVFFKKYRHYASGVAWTTPPQAQKYLPLFCLPHFIFAYDLAFAETACISNAEKQKKNPSTIKLWFIFLTYFSQNLF